MSEQQVFEASELEFTPCQVCKSVNQWSIVKEHKSHGEITHHDVRCRFCRNLAVILND